MHMYIYIFMYINNITPNIYLNYKYIFEVMLFI